jgi:hypothetical protein
MAKSLGTILGEFYKNFFMQNSGMIMYSEAQLAQQEASVAAAKALTDNFKLENLSPSQISNFIKVLDFATRGNVTTSAAIAAIIRTQRKDFVAALQDPPTPDEIDAENEAEAEQAPENIIEVAQKEYSNMSQQVAQTSARRVAEENPVTLDDKRDAAYAQYKEDGNIDKLLSTFATLDNVATPAGEGDDFAQYEFEGQYIQPELAGYYGFSGNIGEIDTYRAQANNENLVPLYNIGLHLTFLENMPSERIIDFQLALEAAGFLDAANISGINDEQTKAALEAAFTYMNTKTQFGIDQNDLNDIAIASGGNNAAFLGFIHDFALDSLDSIDSSDVDPDRIGPDITYLPDSEMLGQQIENAITSVGLPSIDLSITSIRDWANGKIKELNDLAAENNQLSANQYNMAARDAARRKKFGLPEKGYEVRQALDSDDISNAFEYELNKYIRQTYAPLIEANQVDNARRQGIADLISAFSQGR